MVYLRDQSTLFNICINDLATALIDKTENDTTTFDLGLYADDTAFWRLGFNIKDVQNEVQNNLNKLQTWSETVYVFQHQPKQKRNIHSLSTIISLLKPIKLNLTINYSLTIISLKLLKAVLNTIIYLKFQPKVNVGQTEKH